MNPDISKQDLYEAVKTLVECEEPHIHLHQHKLFTLFSIAFQYMLFRSTKKPGLYIIRVEDSLLADKLAKKSKDAITRRFFQALILPRKLKYEKSTFYLDYIHIGSWKLTNDLPQNKTMGALVIKNSSSKPMDDSFEEVPTEQTPEEISLAQACKDLPPDYYISCLKSFVPKTITIAFENEYPDLHKISFPFIKKKEERLANGVKIAADLDLEDI